MVISKKVILLYFMIMQLLFISANSHIIFVELLIHVGPMHSWIMWYAHRIMHAQPQLLSFYFTNKKTKFGQSISLVCSAKDIHPMSCNNPLRVKNVSVQGRVSTQPYVRPQVRLSPLTFYIVTAHQLVLNGIILFSSSGILLLVCDRVDGLPPLFFVMI